MNAISKMFFFAFLSVFSLLPCVSFAGVNLPWSTTFNCDAWVQNPGYSPYSPNCGGVERALDSLCSGTPNKAEEVSALANYPGGGGGKGQIHYLGYGINNHSGGLVVYLNTPQSELWVRYYIKYVPGFTWSWLNYQKQIYVNVTHPTAFVIALKDDHLIAGTGENWWSTSGTGWKSVFSNNNWHCVEFYSKMQTTTSPPDNGVIKIWLNGTKILDRSDVNFNFTRTPGAPNWVNILFGSNAAEITSPGCLGVYYDDIAISNTGRIGCLNAPIDVPPAPPKGLRIE